MQAEKKNYRKGNRRNPGEITGKKKADKNSSSVLSNHYFLLFGCLLITLLCYIPAFTNGWTNWDDDGYVYNNNLTTHLSFSTLPKFFVSFQKGNYHPFAMLSLAVDYSLFGMNAAGFHFHSILLHLVNTTLVFFFVWFLTKKSWVSAITALFFGIHPAHTESVAWISERKDLLYVLYYLLAIIAYLKYLQAPRKGVFYFLTLMLFLFSLLSKGQAVTLPLALLLIDYYKGKPFNGKLIMEKIPFLILSLIFGMVAVYAQKTDNATGLTAIVNYTFVNHLLFSAYALLTYCYKALLPFHLSAFYPYPMMVEVNAGWVVVVLLSLIALIGLVIYSMRKGKVAAFGFGFFLINVLPILQLYTVGGAIMADRYTYLSYVGLFFIIGTFIQWLVDNKAKATERFKIPAFAIVFGCIIFFSIKTFSRNQVWKGNESLYLDMLKDQSQIPVFNYSLGAEYQKQGKTELALKYLSAAIQMAPDYPEPLVSRFNIYWQMGKVDSAIADCSHLIQLQGNDPRPYANRAVAYCVKGNYDAAMIDFNKAISIDPKNVKAFANRGNLYDMKEKYDSAISDYSKALQLDPTDTVVYSNRGRTYMKKGDIDESIIDLNKAIELAPGNAEGYVLRSEAYNAKGNYQQALNDALAAQSKGGRVTPDYIEMLKRKVSGH